MVAREKPSGREGFGASSLQRAGPGEPSLDNATKFDLAYGELPSASDAAQQALAWTGRPSRRAEAVHSAGADVKRTARLLPPVGCSVVVCSAYAASLRRHPHSSLALSTPRFILLPSFPTMPRLLVEIGGDRFHAEIAHVNDPTRPTEIDTYVGRSLSPLCSTAGQSQLTT